MIKDDLYYIASEYSDMYKDTYGFRPKHDTTMWSYNDYVAAIEALVPALTAQLKYENE